MNTGKEAQPSLEVAGDVNLAPPKTSAPIGTSGGLSDNKHSAPSYEAPALRYLGRVPSLRLHLVRSRLRPGELSLRVEADDQTWVPVFEAMNAAGFKPGDVVQLTLVGRDGGGI
jgi:hypothetical protein